MIVECPGCKSRYDVSGRPPGTNARCRCGTTFRLPEPSTEAGQLSCPKCGGSVPPCSHLCQYCETSLKIKACPRCFAKIFHESKHCNQCGAKVDRPAESNADGQARIRDCPRCQDVNLVARVVGDVLLDECPGCHGAFLDVTAVEQIIRERQQASAAAIIGMVENAPRWELASPRPARMYLSCPDCDQLMNRINFGRRSGVLVDVCRYHGTWFDSGELPRVVEYVMKGGLEEAERSELERLQAQAKRRQQAGAPTSKLDTSGWKSHSIASNGVSWFIGTIASILKGP